MSPKNQVRPLSNLCVGLLSGRLIQALCDDEGRNYAIMEQYLSAATYEALQELLKHILDTINLDAATRFSCLQVLLRSDVKKLDTGIFPHSYYEAILNVITQRGVGLQQLNLKGVWVRDHPASLSRLLRTLAKLKILIIPHMVDDEVLEALQKLRYLTILDISGECSYTAEGLEKLVSESISVLHIGNFGKAEVCPQEDNFELMSRIVENLPNLTSLRTYSFTGNALLPIHKRNNKHRTKLKYLHDTGTSDEVMDAILNLCPNMESLHLDTPAPGVIPRMSQFSHLNSVKLTTYNSPEFVEFLKDSGSQLQVLKLSHNKKGRLDLSNVCDFAPNLVLFEGYHLSFSFSQMETSYFMNLQFVEFLYCNIADSVLIGVLTNSPFLKRVVVGCAINMTDGDIFRLCAECDFVALEELWISGARGLTATAVELLMGHCRSLKVLGQLDGWDIHKEEIDYLRAVAESSNLDLTLLPLSPTTD